MLLRSPPGAAQHAKRSSSETTPDKKNRGVVPAIQRLNRQAQSSRSQRLTAQKKSGKKTHGFHQNVFAPSDGACTSLPSHSTLHKCNPSLIARQLENCNRWRVSGEGTTPFLVTQFSHTSRVHNITRTVAPMFVFMRDTSRSYHKTAHVEKLSTVRGISPWPTTPVHGTGTHHREAEKSGEVGMMVTLPPIPRFLEKKQMKNKSKKIKNMKNQKNDQIKN